MIRKIIIGSIAKITGLKAEELHLEIPEREEHGDYATNIALAMFGNVHFPLSNFQSKNKSQKEKDEIKGPRDLAEKIVEKLRQDKELQEIVDKIEVAGAGFINFWLKREVLLKNLQEIIKGGEKYGRPDPLGGKKILLEHTSPNTIKTLHVGHIRNNILGMAVHNILEFCGADVKLDAINNDRGIHVMKAVWAYIKYGDGKTPESEGEKPDHFVDKYYVLGVKESDNPQVKGKMQELLRRWEDGDESVREVWRKLRDWALEGFDKTYKRLGSYHDHQWFESDFYVHGKEMVEEGLRKRVFKKLDDGAVLSDLQKYNLSNTIVLRADGTSMYHTQDLYLTKLKRQKFPSDLYIWDIGPEQDLYLRQLFAMCEQLGIGKRKDYYHLSYGFVYLKGVGKMSSRAGNVVSADKLLDEVVAKAKEIIVKSETGRGLSNEEKNEVSEVVGLGAVKYGFLRLGRTTDLQFNIGESLSLEGDSGPYLQYTFARCQSVLNRAKFPISNFQFPLKSNRLNSQISKSMTSWGLKTGDRRLNSQELALLRTFVRFSETISMSAKNYSPNILCSYLYDLASKFNLFYQKCDILEQRTKNKEQSEFRLLLTLATGRILKNGLNLLGIQAPERM